MKARRGGRPEQLAAGWWPTTARPGRRRHRGQHNPPLSDPNGTAARSAPRNGRTCRGPRLPAAPVTGEGPDRPFPWPGSARRRGAPGSTPRRPPWRRPPRRPALVVELGETGGQGRVLEPPPSSQAPRRRSAQAWARRVVRADGGLGEAASGARSRPRRGGVGARKSTILLTTAAVRAAWRAGLGDADLEALRVLGELEDADVAARDVVHGQEHPLQPGRGRRVGRWRFESIVAIMTS